MSLGKCTRIDVSRNVISFGKIFGQTGKEDRPRIFLLTTEPIWAASHGNVKRTFFLTQRVIGSRWGGKRRKYKTEKEKNGKPSTSSSPVQRDPRDFCTITCQRTCLSPSFFAWQMHRSTRNDMFQKKKDET